MNLSSPTLNREPGRWSWSWRGLMTCLLVGAGGGTATAQDIIWQWYGAAQADRIGDEVAFGGDVNGDGVPDTISGVPAADPNGSKSGQVVVYSGATGAILHQIDGEVAGLSLGRSVARAGDVDKDGFVDFAANAGSDPFGTPNTIRIHSGADGSLIRTISGEIFQDGFGAEAAGGMDVNADGYPDLLASAPKDDTAAQDAGAVYVFSGLDGTRLYKFLGKGMDAELTTVATLPDLNGDGHAEVLVGAPRGGLGIAVDAYAQVYSGIDGSLLHDIPGDPNNNDAFGGTLQATGDMDGDRIVDFLISAPGADNGAGAKSGAVYVFSGVDASLIHQFDGSSRDEKLGQDAAATADVNADGVPDVIASSGIVEKVWLFSGATGCLLHQIESADDIDFRVATAGDVNGDGMADFLVGAPNDGDNPIASGSLTLYAGDDLFLGTNTNQVGAGGQLSLTTRGGLPGQAMLLLGQVTAGGPPVMFQADLGPLDACGTRGISGVVPGGLSGLTLTFRAFMRAPENLRASFQQVIVLQ